MSIQKVRAYFEGFGIADRIREFEVSSATVDLAAIAVGVEGARIAKSLSFKVDDQPIIIVVAGDANMRRPMTSSATMWAVFAPLRCLRT